MKILFLCTGGNSCRSLMAEAFLQHTDKSIEVYSAGLHPDQETDPMAIEVMKEIGIDISTKKPRSYHEFEGMTFDYLITLCDGTKDKIPDVKINVLHKIHLGFDDPRKSFGLEDNIIEVYRDIRDEIHNELLYFHDHIMGKDLVHK